jgi:hypothetical protein
MIEAIGKQEWVSYIEPPPHPSSRAEHVVRYLTRYLTGGPISDHRILAADHHEVTFLAREGKTIGGERQQVPQTLPTLEFVRRWCLHIHPDQLTKTRTFGGWSNTRVDDYLERCVKAMDAAGVASEADTEFDPESFQRADSNPATCEHCGSESLRLVDEIEKPSWASVFCRRSECSPHWYRESQELDDIRFWDGAMGEGFSDWYAWHLKSGIESAREAKPMIRPATQLTLPGIEGEAGISPALRL